MKQTIINGAKAFWRKVREYPARAAAVVSSGLALGIGYGLSMSPEQFGLTMVFVNSLLGFLTEKVVSPTIKLPELDDDVDSGHDELAGR